jgi:hypothetical protein
MLEGSSLAKRGVENTTFENRLAGVDMLLPVGGRRAAWLGGAVGAAALVPRSARIPPPTEGKNSPGNRHYLQVKLRL